MLATPKILKNQGVILRSSLVINQRVFYLIKSYLSYASAKKHKRYFFIRQYV